ncbi:MAG: Mur ligase family protein [Bacteroidota bacterium]|nr:Mur ligase family protein [Bacteroidota bacterium]
MHIHFIAIGGSVMHQLAIALKKKGYEVTGSDDEIFEPALSNLKKEGIVPPEMGWDPGIINTGIDAVILGMHAKDDNPELIKARELHLQIFSFPEYIYKESQHKKRVAIGGSHGKTTTTAMIMHVLKHAKVDFDYLVGARLEGFEQSVKITDAPLIVCEADEYPASAIEKRPKFHFLFPHIAVITGIAWDHINVFPTFNFYLEQFKIFIEKIEKNGVLIYNETDDVLVKLINKNKRNDISYISYALPSYFIENGVTSVRIGNKKTHLEIFGNHNLLNLQASYLVCKQLGVSDDSFADAIGSFKGAAKRLELLEENNEYNIYRDFAHAPSKVMASVNAVKQQFPGRKLVAILELHTFSSLNEKFMNEYAGAMDNADEAIVFYSKHALELKRMPPLDPKIVADGFKKTGLKIINDKEQLQKDLSVAGKRNTNFLFMSSGNYEGIDILKVIINNNL